MEEKDMEKETYKQKAITFTRANEKLWNRFLGYKRMKGPGVMETHPETVSRLLDEVTKLRKDNKDLLERREYP